MHSAVRLASYTQSKKQVCEAQLDAVNRFSATFDYVVRGILEDDIYPMPIQRHPGTKGLHRCRDADNSDEFVLSQQ